MAKLTGIAAGAALKRRIPPARPLPALTGRQRTPGWVSARAVGSFVPGLTRKAFEKHGFSTAALITDWARIVGVDLAAYAAPEKLKWPRAAATSADAEPAEPRSGAMLVLRVDPARALDAEYRARQIIERINAYFGYRAVAELRIVQAPPSAVETSPFGRAATPADRDGARAPSCAKPLAGIDDAGLGLALARLKAGIEGRSSR
jgi:hypothetical protein